MYCFFICCYNTFTFSQRVTSKLSIIHKLKGLQLITVMYIYVDKSHVCLFVVPSPAVPLDHLCPQRPSHSTALEGTNTNLLSNKPLLHLMRGDCNWSSLLTTNQRVPLLKRLPKILSSIRIIIFKLTLYGPNSFFRRFSGHNLR